jgi:hemerythrin
MLIQWSEKYATGLEEIDQQHKEIINQLNRLHDAITAGLGKEVVAGILRFTEAYANKHFEFEETCMERHRCPVAQLNREQHGLFREKMAHSAQILESGDPTPEQVIALYRELRDWIQNHILKVDTNLRSCVHPE